MPSKEKLLAMLQEEPEDTFLLYSLAMEEVKAGNLTEACEIFLKIQQIDPGHVASYHQMGQALMAEGDNEQAVRVLTAGIARAREVGNDHAEAEMRGLLDILE